MCDVKRNKSSFREKAKPVPRFYERTVKSMNTLKLSAMGYLGTECDSFDGVELDIREKDGFTSVYAKGDAGSKFFSAKLALQIKIEEPDFMGRLLAVYRRGEYWCTQMFTENISEVPHDTQMLLSENRDGSFTVILPVLFRFIVQCHVTIT